jgi:polysaccharide chain length determinant protein (PEP-CTERM system associated)
MRPLDPQAQVRLVLNEAFVHRKAVAIGGALLALGIVVAGLLVQQGYTASVTLLADERNIIRPLMEGMAVPTEVVDRVRLAREIIFGRRIMDQILEIGGWMKDNPSPEEQEKRIEAVQKRTKVSTVGRNLIKIEYRDADPERAFRLADRMGALFIQESVITQADESRRAYEFIDKQVGEYHKKLRAAEEELRDFRSKHLGTGPAIEADVGARMAALETKIQESTQALQEAQIKKKSLQRQLSGEAEVATVLSREGQYRARIAELQGQLETLRLSYHETYPDIVRIKQQINDLKDSIAAEKTRRETAKATGHVTIDDSVLNNPMYQALRKDLSETEILIDTLRGRIAEAKRQITAAVERGQRQVGGEATLAELTRDYQVNRDLYQDLLKKREKARVSMNLDVEKQGLRFKVQEPATLPTQPGGVRFLHFLLAGLFLGVTVPLAAIYAKVTIDPRVRVGRAVGESDRVPLLAVVPRYWTASELSMARAELARLGLIVAACGATIALLTMLRVLKVI